MQEICAKAMGSKLCRDINQREINTAGSTARTLYDVAASNDLSHDFINHAIEQ